LIRSACRDLAALLFFGSSGGNLEDSEKTKKAVARFRKNAHFKGVRHLIHILDDDKWLLRENVIESLKILAGNNLSFDVVGITLVHLQCALEMGRLPSNCF